MALGSGSARGWSHIGVIEGLLEAGIKPEIICGCSIGALVGGAFIADRLAALKEWALSLTRTKVASLLDVNIARGGLIKGDLISKFLHSIHVDQPIESYAIPFAAIATDFMTGREIWLQKGPIDAAIRASISIPGIFSPVLLEEKWLLDGGLVNPVPVSACRALGADIIIAVNLQGDILGRRGVASEVERKYGPASWLPQDFMDKLTSQIPESIQKYSSRIIPGLLSQGESAPGYFEVLANSIAIMQDKITRSRLAGDPPHVMLLPSLADFSLMDFHRAEEAIMEGRSCVAQSLPLLRKFI